MLVTLAVGRFIGIDLSKMVGRAWQSQAVNAIVTYWAISIAMVFVNRAVLSSSSAVEDRTVQTTVDAPLFIAWFQV